MKSRQNSKTTKTGRDACINGYSAEIRVCAAHLSHLVQLFTDKENLFLNY